jgi:glycosyltransferase involved in cell wall biosynthesis
MYSLGGHRDIVEAFGFAADSGEQMRPSQYFRIALELLRRGASNLLVVGAGRDTPLYVEANQAGKTVVLEHHLEWVQAVEHLNCTVLPINYTTKLSEGLIEPCPLPEGVPEWVLTESWDVILVDAPEGYRPDLPGRQQSVLLASRLARAGTTLFLHDYEREAERDFAARYLKEPDEVYGAEPALGVFVYADADIAARDAQDKAAIAERLITRRLPVSANPEALAHSPNRSAAVRSKLLPLKVFVLGVPHTQTSQLFCTCPFTMKAWNQCRMLHRRGHEVIHIGVEGSDPQCSENVAVISREEWSQYYGHPGAEFYNTQTEGKYRAYQELYAARVRPAIEARAQHPWEAIVSCTWGDAQIAATRGLRQFIVESGIGYRHTWAKYRVFVSYAWMHFHYGRESRYAGDGWYDVVIPNEIDPDLFDYRPQDKGDELLFMGRLNDDKGVALAIDLARRANRRIAIVGQGDPARFLAGHSHVRYLPAVDVAGRRKLMAEAAALICPTRYIEPLGNVAIEAQASGTPVICTDWGGFTESVLHGVTGYRCRTMEQFVWAVQNIERIDPAQCREWAVRNYSSDRIGEMFDEYYHMLLDLVGEGWYAERPDRRHLNWLRRYFPTYLPESLGTAAELSAS